MILVIGAMASGKRAYVRSLGFFDADMADGVLDHSKVLYNLQDLVFADPAHSQEWLPALLEKEVVVCNEVGSGIIPIDSALREGREATGRLCNRLAEQATRVIRLVCGIPTVIKG